MRVRSRIVIAVVILFVMAGVFSLYLQPNFVVQLANQVWACF